MIGATTRVEFDPKPVDKAVERKSIDNIRHAAFSIRKQAIASIDKAPGPSTAGQPPHTKGRSKGLPRAIRVDMEGDFLGVVGVDASVLGTSMEVHEHSGVRKGTKYQARPFMGPALEANLDRFAGGFGGEVINTRGR